MLLMEDPFISLEDDVRFLCYNGFSICVLLFALACPQALRVHMSDGLLLCFSFTFSLRHTSSFVLMCRYVIILLLILSLTVAIQID